MTVAVDDILDELCHDPYRLCAQLMPDGLQYDIDIIGCVLWLQFTQAGSNHGRVSQRSGLDHVLCLTVCPLRMDIMVYVLAP